MTTLEASIAAREVADSAARATLGRAGLASANDTSRSGAESAIRHEEVEALRQGKEDIGQHRHTALAGERVE